MRSGSRFEVRIELRQAPFPVTHVGFELPSSVPIIAEVHGDLPELPLVPLDFLDHPATLPFQRLVQELRLALAAFAQSLGRGAGGLLRPRFQVTLQLVDVPWGCIEQPPLHNFVRRRTATAQRLVQQRKRSCLSLTGVGPERFPA